MSYKVYDHKISTASFEELRQFKGKAAKEGVVMDEDTSYFAFYVEGHPVGFVGYMKVSNAMRFKSDWVHPDWRGQGIYQLLFKERLEKVGRSEKINAYCTSLSLPVYLKNGFQEIKVIKRGSTFVELKKA